MLLKLLPRMSKELQTRACADLLRLLPHGLLRLLEPLRQRAHALVQPQRLRRTGLLGRAGRRRSGRRGPELIGCRVGQVAQRALPARSGRRAANCPPRTRHLSRLLRCPRPRRRCCSTRSSARRCRRPNASRRPKCELCHRKGRRHRGGTTPGRGERHHAISIFSAFYDRGEGGHMDMNMDSGFPAPQSVV